MLNINESSQFIPKQVKDLESFGGDHRDQVSDFTLVTVNGVLLSLRLPALEILTEVGKNQNSFSLAHELMQRSLFLT